MDVIIRNAKVVNEGQILELDVLISHERIQRIAPPGVLDPQKKIQGD